MKASRLSVVSNNRTLPLKPVRLAVYPPFKVLEAQNKHAQLYHLFFFKNTYLTVKKVSHIRLGSMVHDIFTKGITFSESHPMISYVLYNQRPFPFHSFKRLFQKVNHTYSPQSAALIFALFQSYIPMSKLLPFIKPSYDDFRRNGKVYQSFKILKTLRDFGTENLSIWAKELGGDIAFQKYEDRYHKPLHKLHSEDPLYAELAAYKDWFESTEHHLLYNLYTTEKRHTELLTLLIKSFERQPTKSVYSHILEILEQTLPQTHISQFLAEWIPHSPTFESAHHDIVSRLLKDNDLNPILRLSASQTLHFSDQQLKKIKTLLENSTTKPEKLPVKDMNHILPLIYTKDVKGLEELLRQYIKVLLDDSDVHSVKQWLNPFKHSGYSLQVIEMVDHMSEMENNPDQQGKLGEYYYYFHQLHKAKECFSWEMELHPHKLYPAKWMTTITKELGETEEALVYQKLSHQNASKNR